jgi:hypothetical protein
VIEEFDWTEHALERAAERRFDRDHIEAVIKEEHELRRVNDGRAEWRVTGRDRVGRPFLVIYDHPAEGDPARVRIVSMWELTEREIS